MIAVAAPGAIIAALFALLFMLAWAQWGQSITNTLNVNLPIIGNVIGRLVSDALNSTYQVLVYWFDAYVAPVTELIVRPIAAVENTIGQITSLGANTFNAFWGIVNVRLPQLFAQSVAFTNSTAAFIVADYENLYNQTQAIIRSTEASLIADYENLYNQAIAFTQATAAALVGDMQALYNQSIAYANQVGIVAVNAAEGLYQQSLAFTRSSYAAATAYAESLAVQGQQDLAAAAVQLEGYADATAIHATGVLVTDIDQAIAASLGVIWTDVGSALADVEGVIASDDPDILAAIKAIPHAIPLDIAGVAALAGTTTLTVARYLRDCGIPNCKNLSQIGRELQGLFTVVEDASFLALLVELIDHPSDAHNVVNTVFGSILSTGRALSKEALGV